MFEILDEVKLQVTDERLNAGHRAVTYFDAALEAVSLVVVSHCPEWRISMLSDVPWIEIPRLRICFRFVATQPILDSSDIGITLPKRGCMSAFSRKAHNVWTYIPNSDTNRPARISQLCHGSCVPCHTFPTAIQDTKHRGGRLHAH
jgi:hypothetical protein